MKFICPRCGFGPESSSSFEVKRHLATPGACVLSETAKSDPMTIDEVYEEYEIHKDEKYINRIRDNYVNALKDKADREEHPDK